MKVLGLYQYSEISDSSMSKMIKDTLLSSNLPIKNLRSKLYTYEEVSNVPGKYDRDKASIDCNQQLGTYVHFGPQTSTVVKNALYLVEELDTSY